MTHALATKWKIHLKRHQVHFRDKQVNLIQSLVEISMDKDNSGNAMCMAFWKCDTEAYMLGPHHAY